MVLGVQRQKTCDEAFSNRCILSNFKNDGDEHLIYDQVIFNVSFIIILLPYNGTEFWPEVFERPVVCFFTCMGS